MSPRKTSAAPVAGHQQPRAKRPPTAREVESWDAAPISVLIVDDHELLRLGLRLMIDAEPGLKVCAEVATEADARRLITRLGPAVVVIDLNLQEGTGLDLVKWVTRNYPQTKSVVSTLHDEALYGERVLRAGACGFVSKSAPANTLLKAIWQVLDGQYYFGENLRNKALERLRTNRQATQTPIELLSDRELAVLHHLGMGLASKEIAAVLHISASTVDTYRERLKTKLNLPSAIALIHFATRWVLEQR